jgi:hypothetical protein
MKNLYINGCSFTAGDGLKNEDTWPVKLAELTNTTLYNQAKNGQSFGSIFTNSIHHLNKLDSIDTSVVIGLTWPHRHYFSYSGWNINVTPADFEKPRFTSKLHRYRRISSPLHLITDTNETNIVCDDLRKDENAKALYHAKREYVKAMVTYNPNYKEDMFFLYYSQVLALQGYLEHKKFNYLFIAFDSISGHVQKIKKLSDLNLDKFLYFDITENETMHPTKEDCTTISNKIYETIF